MTGQQYPGGPAGSLNVAIGHTAGNFGNFGPTIVYPDRGKYLGTIITINEKGHVEIEGRCSQFPGGLIVPGTCYLNTSVYKSLHGIDKIIMEINGMVICSNANVTHILGLGLIKGIVRYQIDNDGPIDAIFNKYVGTGDILSIQDELIDAGFIDQARL